MKKILLITFLSLVFSPALAKTLICITDDKEMTLKYAQKFGDKWCKVRKGKISDVCSSGKNPDNIFIYQDVPIAKITTKINRYSGKFIQEWEFREKFADGSDYTKFEGTCSVNKKKKF